MEGEIERWPTLEEAVAEAEWTRKGGDPWSGGRHRQRRRKWRCRQEPNEEGRDDGADDRNTYTGGNWRDNHRRIPHSREPEMGRGGGFRLTAPFLSPH